MDKYFINFKIWKVQKNEYDRLVEQNYLLNELRIFDIPQSQRNTKEKELKITLELKNFTQNLVKMFGKNITSQIAQKNINFGSFINETLKNINYHNENIKIIIDDLGLNELNNLDKSHILLKNLKNSKFVEFDLSKDLEINTDNSTSVKTKKFNISLSNKNIKKEIESKFNSNQINLLISLPKLGLFIIPKNEVNFFESTSEKTREITKKINLTFNIDKNYKFFSHIEKNNKLNVISGLDLQYKINELSKSKIISVGFSKGNSSLFEKNKNIKSNQLGMGM